MSKKAASTTTIIGHSDGPTSVWIGGREKPKDLKGYLRYLKQRRMNEKYKKKRTGIEKKLSAAPHTMDEVEAYIKEKYHAEEINAESDDTLRSRFSERREECKAAMIQRFKPELIGRSLEITPPDINDEESIKRVLDEADEIQRLAIAVPDEEFPLDYHLYYFMVPGKGEYYLEMEKNHSYLSGSYSSKKGKMKAMGKVDKDIFLFYGVSRQDIEEKSERYSMLVTVLAT